MNTINILDINISKIKKNEILNKIKEYLNSGNQHYIVTPNPEIILTAQKDEEFFYILNKADLAIPDGIGLKFAGWIIGKNIKRITGADLVKDILQLSIKNYQLKIAAINLKNGLSNKSDIEMVLENYGIKKYLVEDIEKESAHRLSIPMIEKLNNFKSDILFCALGAPYQEKIIYHNLKKIPSIKLAIGVGGAFDFLTGKIKRAPKIFRIIGLEWLWRLSKQPRRWKRIYNATIIFPWEFFKWRFIHPFLYRNNVACLLYKKEANNFKILLVERMDMPGHWQLPQGGTDGENLITAGARELSEEVGCNKFENIASFKDRKSVV